MSEESLVRDKEVAPPDLFLAFKKRMTERWQKRNERYLAKLREEGGKGKSESKLLSNAVAAM